MAENWIHRIEKGCIWLLCFLFIPLCGINGYGYFQSKNRLASINPAAPFDLQQQFNTRTLTLKARGAAVNNPVLLYLNGEEVAVLTDELPVELVLQDRDLIQARTGAAGETAQMELEEGRLVPLDHRFRTIQRILE